MVMGVLIWVASRKGLVQECLEVLLRCHPIWELGLILIRYLKCSLLKMEWEGWEGLAVWEEWVAGKEKPHLGLMMAWIFKILEDSQVLVIWVEWVAWVAWVVWAEWVVWVEWEEWEGLVINLVDSVRITGKQTKELALQTMPTRKNDN